MNRKILLTAALIASTPFAQAYTADEMEERAVSVLTNQLVLKEGEYVSLTGTMPVRMGGEEASVKVFKPKGEDTYYMVGLSASNVQYVVLNGNVWSNLNVNTPSLKLCETRGKPLEIARFTTNDVSRVPYNDAFGIAVNACKAIDYFSERHGWNGVYTEEAETVIGDETNTSRRVVIYSYYQAEGFVGWDDADWLDGKLGYLAVGCAQAVVTNAEAELDVKHPVARAYPLDRVGYALTCGIIPNACAAQCLTGSKPAKSLALGFGHVFGTAAEFYGCPAVTNKTEDIRDGEYFEPGRADWVLDEDAAGEILRSQGNPHSKEAGYVGPSRLYGTHWSGAYDLDYDEPTDTTLLGHLYFILATGGPEDGENTNDGVEYKAAECKIGREKAETLLFHALRGQCKKGTTYADLGEVLKKTVEGLAEEDPDEWGKGVVSNQVTKAWEAVSKNTLQDFVEESKTNIVKVLDPGVYGPLDTRQCPYRVTITATNGVVLTGGGDGRAVCLKPGDRIVGLTVRDGYATSSGAGLLGGMAENCTFTNNATGQLSGSAAAQATLVNCRFTGGNYIYFDYPNENLEDVKDWAENRYRPFCHTAFQCETNGCTFDVSAAKTPVLLNARDEKEEKAVEKWYTITNAVPHVWNGTLPLVRVDPDGEPLEDPFRESTFTNLKDAFAFLHNRGEDRRVLVADGTYCEHSLQLPDCAAVFMPTSRVGFVTIDAEEKGSCLYARNNAAQSPTFERFVFQNGYRRRRSGGGVSGGSYRRCKIQNCRSGRNGGGAYNADLADCLVVSNQCAGSGGGLYNCNFHNCTVVANSSTLTNGVDGVHNKAKESVGVNSIVVHNFSASEEERAARDYSSAGGSAKVFTEGDPKFVDEANGDYRLCVDSPCIDYGYTDDVRGSDDLGGGWRVAGADVDLGCYEYPRFAALPPGSLNASSNVQSIASVVYAQEHWTLGIDPAASWLSADRTAGEATSTVRFRLAANATGRDRMAKVYVRDGHGNVQTTRVEQVASAAPTGHHKGVFFGVGEFAKDEEGEYWQENLNGSVGDAIFYRDLWKQTDPSSSSRPDDFILLTNAQVTCQALTNAIENIIAGLKPEDEFMLAVSTHGGGPNGSQWIPGFSLHPNGEDYLFEMMTNDLIRAARKCRKVFCCIDTCHSGGAYKFAEQLTSDAVITEYHAIPRLRLSSAHCAPYEGITNIAFIVAADYDQLSSDGDTNGHFTGAAKAAFESGSGADADGDGYLDFYELFRAASYPGASVDWKPTRRCQPRSYNQNLLLRTRLKALGVARTPDVCNPLNPYYVDFANWLSDHGRLNLSVVTTPTNVAEVGYAPDPFAAGMPATWKSFVIYGDTYLDGGVTNPPFRVNIAVTNGTPYVGWTPDLSNAFPKRQYTLYGKTELTNKTWQVVTPEDVKGCHFFKVEVSMPQ